MKKLLGAAVFTLLGTCAFAQTSPGTVVVSGSLNLSTSNSEYAKSDTVVNKSSGTAFSLGPRVGYMLGNNFEIGAGLGFSRSVTKTKYFNSLGDSYEVTTKANAISISPYLKKYFMLSEQFALTGELSAGLSFYKRSTDANTYYQPKSTSFNATLAPGITYFPTDKLGISAGLGGLRYNQTLKKTKAGGTPVKADSGFSFGFEDALYFSLSYYINR